MGDKNLDRLATEEILKETKRASVRAKIEGPQGWLRTKVPSTNKRFLRNMIVSSVNTDKRKSSEARTVSHQRKMKPYERSRSYEYSKSKTKKEVITKNCKVKSSEKSLKKNSKDTSDKDKKSKHDKK